MFEKLSYISSPVFRLVVESILTFLGSLCVMNPKAHWVSRGKH